MFKTKIQNKSIVTLHGLKPGDKREIKTDSEGTPIEKHWRRRLHDSAIDGAIVTVDAKQKKEKEKNKGE